MSDGSSGETRSAVRLARVSHDNGSPDRRPNDPAGPARSMDRHPRTHIRLPIAIAARRRGAGSPPAAVVPALLLALLCLVAATPASPAAASPPAEGARETATGDAADGGAETAADVTASTPLPPRFARWLEEVEPLITADERRLFLDLERDYQREAFIDAFWRVRDPWERTARNELKDRWPVRVAEARSEFGTLEDDRSRILLLHGRPAGRLQIRAQAKP